MSHYLCNVCNDAEIGGKVNIPNELEQIKDSVYGDEVNTETTDQGTLIEKIGIAAAVKVRPNRGERRSPLIANWTIPQNMVYTDAMAEEDQATPSDVEKELCMVCHEEIWDLGEVNDPLRHHLWLARMRADLAPRIIMHQRYNLNPQERRRAWIKAMHTTSQIVRATYLADQVAGMEPFDVNNFDFYAGPDDDEPLESEWSLV